MKKLILVIIILLVFGLSAGATAQMPEGYATCRTCSAEVPIGEVICPECGSPMPPTDLPPGEVGTLCENCGLYYSTSGGFTLQCPECGWTFGIATANPAEG